MLGFWSWGVLLAAPPPGPTSGHRAPSTPAWASGKRWRHLLLEAIRANPGVTFKELVEATGCGSPNARYHLEMMRKAGLIESLQVLHRICFAPAGSNLDRVRTEAYLRFDPKLRTVMSKVAGGPRPATELVQRIRDELHLSRSASWKLVGRAVEAGAAERAFEHRRLIIKARPLPGDR